MFQLAARITIFTFLCLASLVAPASGQDVVIDIKKAATGKYAIAIPQAVDGDQATAKTVADVARFNMNVSGWSKSLDPSSFLADLSAEGLTVNPKQWKDVGAYAVIKYRALVAGGRVRIEFRLYELEKGVEPVLSQSYTGDAQDVRRLTHRFCNEVNKHFTGDNGFFGSKLVFSVKQKSRRQKPWSKIVSADFDGHAPRSITRVQYANILPKWSPDGARIAFTSYMRDNPDLYVVSAGGGRPTPLSKHRGMNIPGSWSPDGTKIAATLSKDGNPEIYILDARTGRVLQRLTNDRAIDTSPAWSPNGQEIAFESDRQGGPQIFVMPVTGGTATRVSFNGTYNTTPAWSPKKGHRMLAYTTRGEDGSFDVVTLDLATKKMTRVTQDNGNYEEPSFSPNGKAVAFARSGSSPGIYIGNADGTGDPVQVYQGRAASVAWGPAP